MCFKGGGGGDGGAQAAADTAAQLAAQQQLSDQQIAAQKAIADQQNAFNEQQFTYEQQQARQQQQQTNRQAARQADYDTGRASLLATGTQQISDAFAGFSDDYFNKYAQDYMAKASDQVDYQKALAEKQLAFGLSRQGISNSQASANQQGLLAETAGRQLADDTSAAQDATNALKANVTNAKQNLLGQVTSAESIGSPIASSTQGGVQSALQTQGTAISGITNTAGDVTASLSGVPTVSLPLNIFSGILGSGGSYLGGVNANNALAAYNRNATGGLGGTSPR